MSSVVRPISILKSSTRARPWQRLSRQFHSPFTVLSPSTSTPATPQHNHNHTHHVYEKQSDHSPDPQTSHAGTRTYVVSEPDASHKPYQVPSGAYPVATPYDVEFAVLGGSVGVVEEA